MDLSGDEDNAYSYTFNEAGTYYLLGLDPNAGVTGSDSAAQYAPATAKVTVTDGSSKPVFDPAEWYKDFDFSSITLDEEGTEYVYNIEESLMYVQHFSNAGEKKVYTVTVPAGTDFVYVNYPADFDQNIVEYCALFESSGEVWSARENTSRQRTAPTTTSTASTSRKATTRPPAPAMMRRYRA